MIMKSLGRLRQPVGHPLAAGAAVAASINSRIYNAPISQVTGWPIKEIPCLLATMHGCIFKTILPHVAGRQELGELIDPIFKNHKERKNSFQIHQRPTGSGIGVRRRHVARIIKKRLYAQYHKHIKSPKPSRVWAIAGNLVFIFQKAAPTMQQH